MLVATLGLLVGRGIHAEVAEANGKSFASGTITLDGGHFIGEPPFGFFLYYHIPWRSSASVTYTYWPFYNLLTRYDHLTMTLSDQPGLPLYSSATSGLYNGAGVLRYTFSMDFGFHCFHPAGYVAITCGGQPTEIWFDPNPGQIHFTGSMGFGGYLWYNFGGDSFYTTGWIWP